MQGIGNSTKKFLYHTLVSNDRWHEIFRFDLSRFRCDPRKGDVVLPFRAKPFDQDDRFLTLDDTFSPTETSACRFLPFFLFSLVGSRRKLDTSTLRAETVVDPRTSVRRNTHQSVALFRDPSPRLMFIASRCIHHAFFQTTRQAHTSV